VESELLDPKSPRSRLTRKLGRAITLSASLAEILRLAEPFGDELLSQSLRTAHDHLLDQALAAPQTLTPLSQ
jgi:hypothetical protein